MISVLFLWLALRNVDLALAFAELRDANPVYSLPAMLVLLAGIWLRAVRWQFLLRPLGRVSNASAFSALTIGYAANNALPARIGEFVRMFVLGRDTGLLPAAILGTIVVERMLDVITLLAMFALAAVGSGWHSPWTTPLAVLGIAAAFGLGLAFLVSAGVLRPSNPVVAPLRRLAERPFGGRIARTIGTFLTGFQSVTRARTMLPVVALSIGSWTVEAGLYYLVLQAMNISAGGFWLAMLLAAVTNLAGVIPAGPGNIGAFEFFTKETIVLFGVPAETAIAYAVAAHVLVLGPPLLLGLYLAWRKGLAGRGRRPEYL